VERRHEDPDVYRRTQRPRDGWEGSAADDGVWRVPHFGDAELRSHICVVDGAGWILRAAQPARWRRVWRNLAQGRHVREEAKRLRRLVCGSGVFAGKQVHHACAAGDYRQVERWSADGCVDDAAAGFVWRNSVRVSAAGYGAVSKFPGGTVVDDGVRVG